MQTDGRYVLPEDSIAQCDLIHWVCSNVERRDAARTGVIDGAEKNNNLPKYLPLAVLGQACNRDIEAKRPEKTFGNRSQPLGSGRLTLTPDTAFFSNPLNGKTARVSLRLDCSPVGILELLRLQSCRIRIAVFLESKFAYVLPVLLHKGPRHVLIVESFVIPE